MGDPFLGIKRWGKEIEGGSKNRKEVGNENPLEHWICRFSMLDFLFGFHVCNQQTLKMGCLTQSDVRHSITDCLRHHDWMSFFTSLGRLYRNLFTVGHVLFFLGKKETIRVSSRTTILFTKNQYTGNTQHQGINCGKEVPEGTSIHHCGSMRTRRAHRSTMGRGDRTRSHRSPYPPATRDEYHVLLWFITT